MEKGIIDIITEGLDMGQVGRTVVFDVDRTSKRLLEAIINKEIDISRYPILDEAISGHDGSVSRKTIRGSIREALIHHDDIHVVPVPGKIYCYTRSDVIKEMFSHFGILSDIARKKQMTNTSPDHDKPYRIVDDRYLVLPNKDQQTLFDSIIEAFRDGVTQLFPVIIYHMFADNKNGYENAMKKLRYMGEDQWGRLANSRMSQILTFAENYRDKMFARPDRSIKNFFEVSRGNMDNSLIVDLDSLKI